MNLLFSLFISFLKVGLFSVGGGYAAIPLIQNQMVTTNHFLTQEEFADLITIAEMTPGPIAINAATFIGMRVGGPLGALVCTFGCICLPIAICMGLGTLYYKYRNLSFASHLLSCLRPGVVSLIACAMFTIWTIGDGVNWTITIGDGVNWTNPGDIHFQELGLFACCLFLLRKRKMNALWIIWGSGIAGLILKSFFTFALHI